MLLQKNWLQTNNAHISFINIPRLIECKNEYLKKKKGCRFVHDFEKRGYRKKQRLSNKKWTFNCEDNNYKITSQNISEEEENVNEKSKFYRVDFHTTENNPLEKRLGFRPSAGISQNLVSFVKNNDSKVRAQFSSTDLSYLRELFNQLKCDTLELKRKERVLNTISRKLKVNADIFGSSVTNLGFKGCDLDIFLYLSELPEPFFIKYDLSRKHRHNLQPTRFLTLPDKYASGQKPNITKVAKEISKKLRNSRLFHNVLSLPLARIPIVKFKCSETLLQGDLSWSQCLGVYNSKLLKTYSEYHPFVEPFVKLIKFWAKQRRINVPHKKSLNSYSYTLMAINFLQNEQIIPSLQELYSEERRRVVLVPELDNPFKPVYGYNFQLEKNFMDHHLNAYQRFFYASTPRHYDHPAMFRRVDISFVEGKSHDNFKRCSLSMCNLSDSQCHEIFDLLLKFFNYYAYEHFNGGPKVISIRKGYVLKDITFGLGNSIDKPLIIEDPFILSKNTASFIDISLIKPEFVRAALLFARGSFEEIFKG
ncbi:hypothetical protein HDU92_001472 [Lobulomyces angularis]|nr:hypothetical protein HDU92_001472 [Lobulomyces angularis]